MSIEAEESFSSDLWQCVLMTTPNYKCIFVNYFGNWTDSVVSMVNLDITDNEVVLSVTLQVFSLNTSKLLDKPNNIMTQLKNIYLFQTNKGIFIVSLH